MVKLQRFIDRLPQPDTAMIKLLIGDSRKQTLEAVFVFEGHEPKLKGDITAELVTYDDVIECIQIEAENLGWGEDFTHIRLNAQTVEGLHIKSLTLSKITKESQGEQKDMGQVFLHLTNCLDRSNRVLCQTIDRLGETLNNERNFSSEVIQEAIQSRRETIDAEATALSYELALQHATGDERKNLLQEALSSLSQIAKPIIEANKPKKPTPEEAIGMIKSMIFEDPNIVGQVMADDEISGKIIEEVMKMNNDSD